VKRVAEHFAMGERWVRECWRDQVQEMLRATHAEAGGMRWLGIDDFARRKGQRYDTIIADLQRRRVIDCVEGRDGKALRRWCEGLPDPWTIEAVVIDMSATFRSVIELCLPRAMIVADHFHVVRRVGKALTQVRLRLQRQQAREGKKDLETLRTVVGRDPATWTKDERAQITALFADLPDLEHAWTLKEAFRAWYKLAERDEAARHLVVWESHVRASGLREFRQLIEGEHAMLVNWREEILNFFPLRLTNGFVEGKNTRTKAFIRQAYGYRNRDNLRLRILQPAA
jgi:transposase